jgi:uncharacterized membrane protein SpoIIM required for sporulation
VRSELQLKSRRFREEREADWRRLERLLERAETKGATKLSRDDLLALPLLYRQALSSLSVARAISLDQSLVAYLESLCTRAYFYVYGVRTPLAVRLANFFRRDWPQAVRALWRETLVAGGLLVLGALVAFLLVRAEPDWFFSFVPAELASGRDPTASTDALRATLYASGSEQDGLAVFAAFLFTHNAQVALFAFALGFALCLPSAALMLYNGCTLGAFLALFGAAGLGVQAGGWLMIHGVTELLAVAIAGAAGLSIGWAVAFPGPRSRVAAAAEAGRRAGTAMAGVVVMLFAAGLLEGFGRQLIQADAARYGVAALTAVLWGVYFYAPRPRSPS